MHAFWGSVVPWSISKIRLALVNYTLQAYGSTETTERHGLFKLCMICQYKRHKAGESDLFLVLTVTAVNVLLQLYVYWTETVKGAILLLCINNKEMEDTDREWEDYVSGINATNSVTVICQTNATDLYNSLVPVSRPMLQTRTIV